MRELHGGCGGDRRGGWGLGMVTSSSRSWSLNDTTMYYLIMTYTVFQSMSSKLITSVYVWAEAWLPFKVGVSSNTNIYIGWNNSN